MLTKLSLRAGYSPNSASFSSTTTPASAAAPARRTAPYNVIQMAAVDPRCQRPSLWSWLALGIGAEPGMEPKVKSSDIPKKAVKCDMCKDLPGEAECVRACPTGAAIRVSPEQSLNYAGPTD